VLERLESDCGVEVVRKVMTVLWASRAGLSESELLGITGLALLQWVPIDLALEQALGRNGNRRLFDHDYLLQAVEDRYLPTVEMQRHAHSELADWFSEQKEWNERKAEELPWQLAQSSRADCLRRVLTNIDDLEVLAEYLQPKEIAGYWQKCKLSPKDRIDGAINKGVEIKIRRICNNTDSLIKFTSLISGVLEECGIYGSLLYRLRTIGLEASRDCEPKNIVAMHVGSESDLSRFLDYNGTRYSVNSAVIYSSRELEMLYNLANSYFRGGRYSEAQKVYVDCIHGWQNLCGWENLKTHSALSGLAVCCSKNGITDWAEVMNARSLRLFRNLKGKDNPETVKILMRMAINYSRLGKHRVAEQLNKRSYSELCRICGHDHQDTLAALNNLGASLARQQKYTEAIEAYKLCADRQLLIFGENHPKYRDMLRKINKTMEIAIRSKPGLL
jgi:tetratricopeptide (TPR) repeat protein